jgi:uncharacterized protein YjiS (DUF1127 family)
METAMTSDVDSVLEPRKIGRVRKRQAKALRHYLDIVVGKMHRAIGALRVRITRATQRHRELELLMHADDRMLADIGLTRYDVVTAAQESRGWRGRRDALQAAAARRDDAVAMSAAKRAGLAHIAAPALAPALPHALETSNFR